MSPNEPLQITGIDRNDGNELIVEYSDLSTAVYTVDQLSTLEPKMKLTVTDLEEEISG